jgi:hypothetical protein
MFEAAGVDENSALQAADTEWELVFEIKDGEDFAAQRIAAFILRSNPALSKTADRRPAAVEEADIDRDLVGPRAK